MIGLKLKKSDLIKLSKDIEAAAEDVERQARRGLGAGARVAEERIRQNLSAAPLSRAQLAAAGHPFARRHGEIRGGVGSPSWAVHRQSGAMAGALEVSDVKSEAGGASVEVSINASKAPHAVYVIAGTARLLPRPVLSLTLADLGVQRSIFSEIAKTSERF